MKRQFKRLSDHFSTLSSSCCECGDTFSEKSQRGVAWPGDNMGLLGLDRRHDGLLFSPAMQRPWL